MEHSPRLVAGPAETLGCPGPRGPASKLPAVADVQLSAVGATKRVDKSVAVVSSSSQQQAATVRQQVVGGSG